MSSDRNEILLGGWPSDGSSKVRILSKSVKRFRGCGGRNLPIPINLAIGLYNSLCYRTSRDYELWRTPFSLSSTSIVRLQQRRQPSSYRQLKASADTDKLREVTSNIAGSTQCGPMPNVMAALPNIGGAVCSTPQFG